MASSSSSSPSFKKFILRTFEGEVFEIDENAARLSQTLKHMIKDLGDCNNLIQVPNVDSIILSKIIEYCNKHVVDNLESETTKDEIKQWHKDFLKLDQETLFKLIHPPTSFQSTSSCACSSKKIVLKTNDKEFFYINENVALQSITIKHMIADLGDNQGQIIPLPNVDGKTLGKVIEYCKMYEAEKIDRDADDDIIKSWEEKFLEELDQDTLFDVMLAANYMEIKSLLMATCKYVARTMQGNTPEEIRKMYNIKNDYTPEQEEEIRRQNPWAFDAIERHN